MNGFNVFFGYALGRMLRHRYFAPVALLNLVMVVVSLPNDAPYGMQAYRPALATLNMLWSFVLLVAGAGILDRDFLNGFAFLVLTKPVRREAYVLGKAAALSLAGVAGATTALAAVLVHMALHGDTETFQWGLLAALLTWAQLTVWAVCLVGLSGFVAGIGNSLCFYGLLVMGTLLAATDLMPWTAKPLLALGELLHPPNLFELYATGLQHLPRWMGILHAFLYPGLLLAWGLRSVSRRELMRVAS